MNEEIKLWVLWKGDNYVDIDGSTQPDCMIGVFTSIDNMNDYVKRNWFDFPFGENPPLFDMATSHLSHQGKQSTNYMYFETHSLNP